MKNLKNMFAWITLALILTVGTIGANAGIIVGDRTTPAPCSENTSDGGIMISDATCQNGVMIAD